MKENVFFENDFVYRIRQQNSIYWLTSSIFISEQPEISFHTYDSDLVPYVNSVTSFQCSTEQA